MKFIGTITFIGALLWFAFILQKWKKSIKETMSPFDSAQAKRRKKGAGFFIDIFSFGFVGIVLLMLYLMFLK